MDMAKLDRTRMALAVIGLLAFVDSFLEWAHLKIDGHSFPGVGGNAWNMGIGAWFPLLLLLALGVVAALPAFGTEVKLPGGLALVAAAVGVLSVVIVLLRWVTLPSYLSASLAASYGLFIGLVLGVAAAVFGWLAYTAEGGSFNTIADSFKNKQVGPPSEG